jgi:hypothetical protein
MDPNTVADIYRHKKSGAFYERLSEVVDATNSRNGTRAVVYCRVDSRGVPQFVRELAEFEEKFERVDAPSANPQQPGD